MKKKTNLLFVGTSLLVVAAAAGTAFSTLKMSGVWGTDDTVWNHYSAVAASLGVRGIKEYWVSCDDHSHQFSAPVSEHIVDKGAPSREFIDSLDVEDDRLIEYKRYYDFSDRHLPSFITPNTNVSDIVVGNTLDAENYMVEITVTKNDYGANIGKEYLDAAFADPNVAAIAFDAYSTEISNNFRHRHNGSNSTYESGTNDSGLASGFKSFYFTRAMYDEWVSGTYVGGNGDCVIWGGGSVAPKTLYIDNLRVASRNATTEGYMDFETGYFPANDQNYRQLSNTACFAIGNLASGYSPSFSYDVKTNGNRSIYFNKTTTAWTQLTVNTGGSFYQGIPDEGFLVDIRATDKFNHSNGIRNGQSSDNLPWNGAPALEANTWYTYHIQKTRDINTSGRFMQIAASTTAEWYIDNFRYATGTTFGFEGSCVKQYGDYVTIAGQEFAPEDSGVLRDQTQCYNMIFNNNSNMITFAGLDSEHVTEGAQALKLTFEHTGYNVMSFEPYLIEALDSVDTVSIDVYSDGVTFASGSLFEDVTPGSWTTITFSKSQLTTTSAYSRLSSKSYRTQADISHIGSVWFDNIRTANVD